VADLVRVRVSGLNFLDKSELKGSLAEAGVDEEAVSFQEAQRVDDGYGEPATIVAIISVVALKAFIAWLAMRPRNGHLSETFEIQVGETCIRHHIEVEIPEGADTRAEVVAALKGLDGLPPEIRSALSDSAPTSGQANSVQE